jgi:hypothetical protein
MITALIGFLALVALYAILAAFICCEFNDDKARWWCPFCVLFGKRRTP